MFTSAHRSLLRCALPIVVVGLFAVFIGNVAAQQGAQPLPAQLGPKALAGVKRATVRLQVTIADGEKASGSGFFALQPGIVITNAHVVGMLGKQSKDPKEIAVVLNSGQANEESLKATVVGVDRINDLAVLRVEGKDLPAPLPIETQRELFETQKAYVFGFPLGIQLGKDITISETSISSLRTFGTDKVQQVQVNGGIHPGNSGGPIVNTDGAVIGVSVAIIRGSQLNFAVPGHFVSSLASGRITDNHLGEAFLDKGKITLPVRFACLDPLDQVKEVRVDVWAGMPGKPLSAATQRPRPDQATAKERPST
jgi:S1-C subfamily serine protease